MDFGALPPEINSARIYSGPGPAPLLAAASAWTGLAAELGSAAVSYSSVVSALASDAWLGPASASMAAAAAPFATWMSAAAAQAEQTAAQAQAAAAAYEAAFAATVPPAVIAANRALLTALVATNFLGQNTPAIAATEAHYAEMWAQDAATMYAYAGSSAAATQLTAFSQPQQTTNAGGLAAQSAAVSQAAVTSAGTGQSTLSQLMSAVTGALQELASPTASGSGLGGILDALGLDTLSSSSGSSSTGLSGLLNLISGSNGSAIGQLLNSNLGNSIFGSGFFMPSNYVGSLADFMGLGGQAAGGAAGEAAAAAAGPVTDALQGPLGGLGALGNSVSAGMGQGAMVGRLSVPPSWTAPVPLNSPLASALGGTPMTAPPAAAPGMPGVPLGNFAGQISTRPVPQYGFRPTFTARPPAAG